MSKSTYKKNSIALFDLDGTLADYNGALIRDLNDIRSPYEPEIVDVFNEEEYIEKRRHVITSQNGWWKRLEAFELGFDILQCCKNIGYDISVLTKGPSTKASAWSEKLEWCNFHLKDYISGVTITHNKGLVYGNVLVDDYPEYIEKWLEFRPRGLVIMPAQTYNKNFKHPNVIRYDGENIREIISALIKQFDR